MALLNPLDLQTLLVSYLTGNYEIFSFVAILAIASMAAYFRMPNQISLIMIGIFAIIMQQYVGGLYLLTIIIVGLMVYYSLARFWKG